MRKGMALGLAGIVAASLVGVIAMFGGRVDAAQADAAGEPQVITEHRTITKYRTETVAPDVIVVASPATAAVADDEQGEDESEASETAETESPTPSPSEGSDSGSWSDDDSSSLDGHGESHDD